MIQNIAGMNAFLVQSYNIFSNSKIFKMFMLKTIFRKYISNLLLLPFGVDLENKNINVSISMEYTTNYAG